MVNSDAPTELTEDLAYDLLSCLEPGTCGELKYLNDKDVKIDLSYDISHPRKFTDPETGDLILKDVRILSPGIRNGYEYSQEEVQAVRYYKGHREMPIKAVPLVVPHSSNPLERIGNAENVRYDKLEDSIIGNLRIYNDEKLPTAQAAIALINREPDFLSVSTRLKAEPKFSEGKKPRVKNLRLIHVAWVDVGADPTAGISMQENVENAEIIDNLLPLSDKSSWDGGGAEKRVWEWSEQTASKAKAAYMWSAPDPQKQSDLKLPFADVIDDKLQAVNGGVVGCFGAMRGARGGVQIPDADRAGVMTKIHSYYTAFGLNWPADESSDESPDKLDTKQQKLIADGVDENNNMENRGPNMAKEKPTTSEPEPEAADVENAEPSNPNDPSQTVLAEVTPTVITNNANPAGVIQMTQEQFDLKLEEALKEHDALMQAAYQRKELISEITKIDSAANMEFLVSLSAEQLTEYKVAVERLLAEQEKLAVELAGLQKRLPIDNFGEKPSYGGGVAGGPSLDEIERVYPSRTPEMIRREAAIKEMTARMGNMSIQRMGEGEK